MQKHCSGVSLITLWSILCLVIFSCGGSGTAPLSSQVSPSGGEATASGGDATSTGEDGQTGTDGDGSSTGGGGQTGGFGTEKWKSEIFQAPVISANNSVTLQLISSPAIAPDGTIYVGSKDNRIYALRENGTIKWQYDTGDQIVASPAIGSDGTVYVGSADRQLFAINPDGTLKWVFPTKVVLSSSPALGADGTIYVAGTDLDNTYKCGAAPCPIIDMNPGTIYAVNPNGTLKWRSDFPGNVNSSPSVASDGTIYISSWDCDSGLAVRGRVYSFNPAGGVNWRFVGTAGAIDSSAGIGPDGTIYVGTDAYCSETTGYLYALNAHGGQIWRTDLYGNVKSSPAIAADGTIYVGSDKEDVFAINPNGTIKWQFPTRGPVKSSPAIAADGTIYIGSNDTDLYALNPNGTVKLRFVSQGPISSSPALNADSIYFVSLIQSGTSVLGEVLYSLFGDSPLADTASPKFRHDLLNTGRK